MFQYLQVAWLTYPYHCCAFQFPATHHPEEFAKHEVRFLKTKIEIRNTSDSEQGSEEGIGWLVNRQKEVY
jgi:hypothetical protein